MTEKEVWKMDNEIQQIGNDGRLSIFERLDRMDKELADQKEKGDQLDKELAYLKEKDSQWDRMLWKSRIFELERVIHKTHNAAHFKRDEIIYGTDILNDYQALRYANRPDNQSQFKTASQGFEKAYGLQLSCLSYNTLSRAPDGVIDMLTIRGNLVFLNWSLNHKEQRDIIEKQCDAAVRKWFISIETNGIPYAGEAITADYKKVKKLYDMIRACEKRCQ